MELQYTNDLAIKKEHVLGISRNIRYIAVINDDSILYCCSANIIVFLRHSRQQIFLHQSSSTEQILHIVLCPQKKLLSVAVKDNEAISIIIYDVTNSRRKKILCQEDHLVYLVGVSFSNDSKQILVLGGKPDYLLTLWTIEKLSKVTARINLTSLSSKCLKKADICPFHTNVVCVTGNEVLRIFKIVDNVFRPVTVKLKRDQQNYVDHCWLENDKLVIATQDELIILINFETRGTISLKGWDQLITTIVPFSKGVLVGGTSGNIRVFADTDNDKIPLCAIKDIGAKDIDSSKIQSIAVTEEICCYLTSYNRIILFPFSHVTDELNDDETQYEIVVPFFHTVTCIDVCLCKPILITGGSDQAINVWNYNERKFELHHNCGSDIISVSLHPSGYLVLLCCNENVSLGSIQHTKIVTIWSRNVQTTAASCFSNGGQYFALHIGLFVQIFHTYTCSLISTLTGHLEKIQSIHWKEDDQMIGTIGKDCNVSLWNVSTGEIKFRHSHSTSCYISGILSPDFSVAILNTGTLIKKLDIIENSSKDDILIPGAYTKMIYMPLTNILIGAFDKSCQGIIFSTSIVKKIKIKSKALHSETVTNLQLTPDQTTLFTSSADGSLCVSSLNHCVKMEQVNEKIEAKPNFDELMVSESEIDIIDHEISKIQIEVNDAKRRTKLDLLQLEKDNMKIYKKVEEDLIAKKILLRCQYEEMKQKIKQLKIELNHTTTDFGDSCQQSLQGFIKDSKMKINRELDRISKFDETCNTHMNEWTLENESIEASHQSCINLLSSEYQVKSQRELDLTSDLSRESTKIMTAHKDISSRIEEDAENEISIMINNHDNIIYKEQSTSKHLVEENDILKKGYTVLMKDYNDLKETILSLKDEERGQITTIQSLELAIGSRNNSVHVIGEEIEKDVDEINKMTECINQGERFKYIQNEELEDIRQILTSKEEALILIQNKAKCVTERLVQNQQVKKNTKIMIQNLNLKYEGMKKESILNKLHIVTTIDEILSLQLKVRNASMHVDCTKMLKQCLISLFKEYIHVEVEKNHSSNRTNEIGKEEREVVINCPDNFLKKDIIKIETTIHSNDKRHSSIMSKLQRENIILKKDLNILQYKTNRLKQGKPQIGE